MPRWAGTHTPVDAGAPKSPGPAWWAPRVRGNIKLPRPAAVVESPSSRLPNGRGLADAESLYVKGPCSCSSPRTSLWAKAWWASAPRRYLGSMYASRHFRIQETSPGGWSKCRLQGTRPGVQRCVMREIDSHSCSALRMHRSRHLRREHHEGPLMLSMSMSAPLMLSMSMSVICLSTVASCWCICHSSFPTCSAAQGR